MMKKINFLMLIQWLLFAPLLIPIGIITGAFEGLRQTFLQAEQDIFKSVHDHVLDDES